jgi:tRNA threonylcarbamoyladenosine biosynthesis protein TsaB
VSWLLNIDTAVQTASVCLAKDDKSVGLKINLSQNDHASWLQPAIASLLSEHNLSIDEVDAIAVSAGPGSYTGLRVGMAAAKGLCFALNKPLILISTLKMMATAVLSETSLLICPMIDARRMEVFTAVYDHSLNTVLQPHNHILSHDSFASFLEGRTIVFFGNGSAKFRNIVAHPNAIFKQLEITAEQMTTLAYESYRKGDFANLAYCEPLYTKEFFSPASKKNEVI